MCCGSASVPPTRQPSAHRPGQLPRRRLPAPSWAARSILGCPSHPPQKPALALLELLAGSQRDLKGSPALGCPHKPESHPAWGVHTDRRGYSGEGIYTDLRGGPMWGNSSTLLQATSFPSQILGLAFSRMSSMGSPDWVSVPVPPHDTYQRPWHCLFHRFCPQSNPRTTAGPDRSWLG